MSSAPSSPGKTVQQGKTSGCRLDTSSVKSLRRERDPACGRRAARPSDPPRRRPGSARPRRLPSLLDVPGCVSNQRRIASASRPGCRWTCASTSTAHACPRRSKGARTRSWARARLTDCSRPALPSPACGGAGFVSGAARSPPRARPSARAASRQRRRRAGRHRQPRLRRPDHPRSLEEIRPERLHPRPHPNNDTSYYIYAGTGRGSITSWARPWPSTWASAWT